MSTLKQKLAEKTDDQLMFYIHNVDKHTEEAVRLALAELKNRSVELPVTIDEDIERALDAKTVREHQNNKGGWKKNIVEDLDAPEYYSKTAIYVFSILFSVFFGSFMLASNCKDAGKPSWPVILFGLLYTIIAITALDYYNLKTSFNFIINSIGVLLMYELFWGQSVGADTKYRAKPIWKPMIIAAAIFIPLIALMIYGLQTQR